MNISSTYLTAPGFFPLHYGVFYFPNQIYRVQLFTFIDVDHFFLLLPIPVVGYLEKNIIIANNLVHHFVKLLIHYL